MDILQIGDKITIKISEAATIFNEKDISQIKEYNFLGYYINNIKQHKYITDGLYKFKKNTKFELVEECDNCIIFKRIGVDKNKSNEYSICRSDDIQKDLDNGVIVLDMKHRRLMNINKLLDTDI